MKIKRKVHLSDYDAEHDESIKIDNDLPWPQYVIHENKVFIHEGKSIGAIGYYRRDLGFYNTIVE